MITNIKQFKESIHWKPSNLKAREQLLIDNWTKILSQEVIEGHLTLDQWALKVDPKGIKVRKINGYLNLYGLGLTRLPEWIGQIEEVTGGYDCSRNQLTSLEGLPKWIGGNFFCYSNPKQFTLDDIPKDTKIGGQIYF